MIKRKFKRKKVNERMNLIKKENFIPIISFRFVSLINDSSIDSTIVNYKKIFL